MEYYKFFVQKENDGAEVKELGADFGCYEVESKFYGGGEVKDLAKRDWHDEHGDDEFVPDDLMYKAYDMSVKFACKGDVNTANTTVNKLKEYLAKGGMMKIYDEYNNVGRQHVRFEGIPDDATLYRHRWSEDEALVFTVKLKVNDPYTDITLSK